MSNQILVPSLGESVTEATVSKWLKQVGDSVDSDEPLVELETDKVNIEVPSPSAGTLSSIKVKEGDTAEVGALLGIVNEGKPSSTKTTSIKSVAQDEKSYKPPKANKQKNKNKNFVDQEILPLAEESKEEKSDDYTAEELEEALRYQLQRLEAFQKISKTLYSKPLIGRDVFYGGSNEGVNIKYDIFTVKNKRETRIKICIIPKHIFNELFTPFKVIKDIVIRCKA